MEMQEVHLAYQVLEYQLLLLQVVVAVAGIQVPELFHHRKMVDRVAVLVA
jgi:hypothetical protein